MAKDFDNYMDARRRIDRIMDTFKKQKEKYGVAKRLQWDEHAKNNPNLDPLFGLPPNNYENDPEYQKAVETVKAYEDAHGFDDNSRVKITPYSIEDEKYWGTDLPQEMQDELKNRYRKALKEEGYSDEEIEAGAEDHPNEKLYTLEDFYGKKFWETPEWTSLVGKKEDVKEEIDTNDNGEIEVDEMADFQKSLDDYAAKNKKGRDDIPVTTRR